MPKRGDEAEALRRKPDQFAGLPLLDSAPPTVAQQGEPKDSRSLGHTLDSRQPDPQWKRILRALAERPNRGATRHELTDLFAETSHPIPLASVCRVVGEKLLPDGLAEVSSLITRESKYHADNSVLFITPKGRGALKQERAA